MNQMYDSLVTGWLFASSVDWPVVPEWEIDHTYQRLLIVKEHLVATTLGELNR